VFYRSFYCLLRFPVNPAGFAPTKPFITLTLPCFAQTERITIPKELLSCLLAKQSSLIYEVTQALRIRTTL